LIHSEEGLAKALKVTEGAAPGATAELDPEVLREIAKDMPSYELELEEVLNVKFVDLVVKVGLLSSKSEAVRLIQSGGGVYLNNEKVTDIQLKLSKEMLIDGEFLLFGLGKKKKMLVKVKRLA